MSQAHAIRTPVRATAPNPRAAVLWAIAAAAVPTLIRASLDGVVSDATYPAYFPFILAAATFLGWRSAMLTAVLSGLAANFLFTAPRFELFATEQDIGGTLLFLASSIVVILGVQVTRRAPRAAAGPQARVAQRTGGRRWPLGYGLLIGAALSLGLWAGAIWAGLRLLA